MRKDITLVNLLRTATLFALLVFTSVAVGEQQNVIETFTVEKRGLAGWETEALSCKNAIAAAKESAKSRCDKEDGEVLKTLSTDCNACKQTRYFKEWYCTGAATIQCEYYTKESDPGFLDLMRKKLHDKNGKPYTETENPCSKDTQTNACSEYRKAKRMVYGVKG